MKLTYLVDVVFMALFSLWFRILTANDVRNDVLVIQLVAMGDMINASSFYRQLKKEDNQITVICHRKFYDLYNHNNPYVDEWILFDDSHRSIIGKWKFFRELAKHNISITYDLTGSYFSKWLGWSTCSEIHGVDLRNSGFNWIYDYYIANDTNNLHIVEVYLALLLDNYAPLVGSPTEFWGMKTYRPRIFNKHYHIMAVGIGAGVVARQWTNQGFADVINHMIRTYKYKVVLLGTKADCAKAQAIMKLVRNKRMIYDFTGKTTIGQVGYVVSKSKLLVANDSGLTHIGASVGTPTVAIFGPVSPTLWRPYGNIHKVVRADNCEPCGSNPTCKDVKCLTELNSNMVIDVIKEMI